MLRPFGIKEIAPEKRPGSHQSYTHSGWDKGYYERLFVSRSQDQKDWEKRKGILRDVTRKILSDRSLIGWLPFVAKADEEKVECFCELVYYVHVLGGYNHDKDGPAFTGSELNGYKIPFASAHGECDIFPKLKECFKGLFKNQPKKSEYRDLMDDLDDLRCEAQDFALEHEESYDIIEDYELVHGYAEKLMALLMGSDDYFE